MRSFLIKLGVTTLALAVADQILQGIHIESITTLVVAGFLLNLANAFLRPIFVFFTLPITVVSFGFFLIIINGFIFMLVANFLPGFTVYSFGSAILGWILTALASSATYFALGESAQRS